MDTEMITHTPWPGDVGISGSVGKVGPAIRWMTTKRGEKPSFGSHAFIFDAPDHVVEADWNGVVGNNYSKYESTPHRVYRMIELPSGSPITWRDRLDLADFAIAQIGIRYGYATLFLHAFDGLLNKVWRGKELFFARKVAPSKHVRICSQHVAKCYWDAFNYVFGHDWTEVDPDHIDDHCSRHSWWVLVREVSA